MMCLEESRNHNTTSKPQMSPSSSKSSPSGDQLPVIQWARCLHCPMTWKCQGSTATKDDFVLDVPYQGLTKFVACDDCSKISGSTASETKQVKKDTSQMDELQQVRNMQQLLTNSILSGGNMNQPPMNLLNFLPLIYNQLQQTHRGQLPPAAANTNMDLFQNLLQQQQMVQQQVSRYKNVKENNNNNPQKKYQAPPPAPAAARSHQVDSSRMTSASDRQQAASEAAKKSIQKQRENTIDLNNTRVALGQQQQQQPVKPTLPLDDRRLISILKTMPHLMLNPESNTQQQRRSLQLHNSNQQQQQRRQDIKIVSELSKRLEDAPQPPPLSKEQHKQQFSSPAMQSLAEIGRSPGAIWKGDADGRNVAPMGDETPFHCVACSKSFKSRSLLKIHQRVHVTSDGQNKCNMCDYVTSDYHQLISHMHHQHSEQLRVNSSNSTNGSNFNQTAEVSPVKCKPAVCPVCGRKSPSLGYLKIHMRSHKTTLDHVCPVCGRGFKEHWYLTTHLRTHDKGLVNSPQFNGGGAGPDAGIHHSDELRRVQHNEVQQQLRLMIERNRQNSEAAYRGALQLTGNPLLSIKNNTNMFIQNLELAARGGEMVGSGIDHHMDDNNNGDDSANSPSPPPFKRPSTEEDETCNEQYRFRVSKRKAFHPVKCSQDEVVPSKRVASPDLLLMPEGWTQATSGRRKSRPQKLDVNGGTDENLVASDREEVVSEEESGSVARTSPNMMESVETESTATTHNNIKTSSSSSSSSNQPLDLRVLKIDEKDSSCSSSSSSFSGTDEKFNGSVSR